jgi:hypothetical protein
MTQFSQLYEQGILALLGGVIIFVAGIPIGSA